jgi:hypothetical protein
MAGLIRRMPKRKTVKSKKIAGRFCFSRNPSGTLFPNANPETRGQLEAFSIRCQSHLKRFRQTQTPRQTSSDLKFIAERRKLCKGESRMSLAREQNAVRIWTFPWNLRKSVAKRLNCLWCVEVRIRASLQRCQTTPHQLPLLGLVPIGITRISLHL